MDLPEKVREELDLIIKSSGLDAKQIETIFESKYDHYYKTDSSFKTESGEVNVDDLYETILMELKCDYVIRQKIDNYDIIPVGIDQVRETQQKDITSSLYVVDSERVLRRVSLSGKVVELLADIQLLYLYKKVPLSKLSSGDLMADNRTKLGEIRETELGRSPEKVVQLTKAKKIVLSDIYNSNERILAKDILSKLNKDKYAIKTDWRAIYGMATSVRTGSNEENGTNWASFRIVDKTIDITKEYLDDEGNPVMPGIMCYCSPYVIGSMPDRSKVWALGPLSKSKKGFISMNAYCVIPTWEPPSME